MKKSIVLSLIFALTISYTGISQIRYLSGQLKESVKTDSIIIGMKKEEDIYKIDSIIVNQEEFEAFIKSMKQVEGTYMCAKTTTGGRVSYILLDKNGVEWFYSSAILKDEQYYTIHKKEY